MTRFALLLTAICATAAGCGPSAENSEADSGTVVNPVDAAVVIDARPADYTISPPRVLIYAHSATTLYTVDQTTFATTTIGTFNNNDAITDIAVTPQGEIYGLSRTKVYSIDRSNGQATLLAPISGSSSNVGMTFLPDGTLLATDKSGGVRRIDPANGAVTEVGTFGGGLATAGDLVAVADGTMYAISDKGPNGTDASTNNWLITVNTSTGRGTVVGQIGFGRVYGAAYANGKVYAFTDDGRIVEINRTTGAGTLVRSHQLEFWGAGVTSSVPID